MIDKLVFLSFGHDGQCHWKCCNCRGRFDAGYPQYGDDHTTIVASDFKFCPHCGVQFVGVQPNTKQDAPKYYRIDVAERMRYRYSQLQYLAESKRRHKVERIQYFAEYRERVAEHLDELEEYTAECERFCRPRIDRRFA